MGVFHSSKLYFPPIYWELIEDKLVITKVLNQDLPIKVGDVVTKVNKENWKTFWQRVSDKSPGATRTRKNYRFINESLGSKENDDLNIETQSKTNSKNVIIKRNLSISQYLNLLDENHKTFEEIESGIFYVNLTKINWSDLQKRIPDLAKSKGIIFDLRGYPKWQTIKIVSHFINKPVEQVQLYIPQIIYPDQFETSLSKLPTETILPEKPFIGAKKVFLTNGSAISYSETILNLIEFYRLADIVGEQTAGTTGQTNITRLFDGISIPWTGMRVLRQDGSKFHSRGVIPNYPLERTVKGIKDKRDEYLEKALQIIRQNKRFKSKRDDKLTSSSISDF